MDNDTISRQAAIDYVDDVPYIKDHPNIGLLWKALVEQLPSAQPERKKGKWIDKGWNGDWQYQTDGRGRCWHEWQCSECNDITKGAKWDFCPNCGADMRGEQDG